jgi:hypothetical protein
MNVGLSKSQMQKALAHARRPQVGEAADSQSLLVAIPQAMQRYATASTHM